MSAQPTKPLSFWESAIYNFENLKTNAIYKFLNSATNLYLERYPAVPT